MGLLTHSPARVGQTSCVAIKVFEVVKPSGFDACPYSPLPRPNPADFLGPVYSYACQPIVRNNTRAQKNGQYKINIQKMFSGLIHFLTIFQLIILDL